MHHESSETHMNLLTALGIHLSQEQMVILAIVLFVLTYTLILLEKYVHRTVGALLGACGVMVLGLMTPAQAWGMIDFNTLFLLFGMMNIVNVLSHSGFFDLVAKRAMLLTRGEPVRVLWIFSLLTALFSALLDNVTTVLFMAPIVIMVVTRLKLPPIPYLVAIILASNLGGTATLIGDPPNIIIGSVAGKSFADFLINVAPYAILVTFIGIALMQWLLKRKGDLDSTFSSDHLRQLMEENVEVKSDAKLMRQALITFGITLLLFIFGHPIGLEAGLIALTTSTFLMLVADFSPTELLEKVEWTTLLFFMGLFVVVGALEHLGIFKTIAQAMTTAIGDNIGLGILGVGFLSAIISGFVDNIPFTISMASVLKELEITMGNKMEPLWWALSLGACLGGNLTLIGASANIVVSDIAAREGHPISFMTFMKYGSLVAIVTTTIALLLYYFVHTFIG